MSLEDENNDVVRPKKRKKLELANPENAFNDSTPKSANESALRNENEILPAFQDTQKRKKIKKSKLKGSAAEIDGNLNSLKSTNDTDTISQPTRPDKQRKKNRKNKKSKKNIKFKMSKPTENDPSNSCEASSRSEKAISYLDTWKNDRTNWKFEKLTQFWLLKNMFDKTVVPKTTFKILLEYLVDLKGASKDFAVELCEGIIKKMKDKSPSDEKDKVLEGACRRARSILQCLQ